MIRREDMLELTRRMTDSRTHLARIAGTYMDEEGNIDGTFHTNFQNLKGEERRRCLEIAKAVPYAKTNEELTGYRVPGMKPGTIWQLLYALRDCELKNDGLLLTLYEYIGEHWKTGHPYAVYVYYGCYDIPKKASDHVWLDESEEVYRYLILTICPMDQEYIPDMPDAGFLYPALTDRSSDLAHVNLYIKKQDRTAEKFMKEMLLLS